MKFVSHQQTAEQFRDTLVKEIDRRVSHCRGRLASYRRMEGRIAKKRIRELETEMATLDTLNLWLAEVEFE